MFERLNQLIDADTRARWRIMVSSGAVIVACGLMGEFLTDARFAEIQILATVAGLIAFGAQALIYCTGTSIQPLTWPYRASQLIRIGVVTAVLVAVGATSLSRVQAAVLAQRLRRALRLHNTELRFAAVTRVVKDAEHERVQLNKYVVQDALNELNQNKTDDAWRALVAFLEYIVNARTDVPRRPSAAADWLEEQPVPMENVCGPQNYTQGADAQLTVRHGEWIHSKDLTQWPDTIHHCRLVLDGATLSNVYLWAVTVTYRGGQLHLNNVRFGQCRFDLPDGRNANVRDFVNALLTADRNVISIELP